jgi:hypothetical protein
MRAPFNRQHHISSVEASNETGAICKKTSTGENVAKLVFLANRTTARWGTHTPFGLPVDPEVKLT